MKRAALIIFLVLTLGFIAVVASQDNKPQQESPFTPSMQEFAKKFKGAGEGVDGAGDEKPYSLEESLRHFQVVKGLEMAAVAGEPIIRQPLNLHFDERGRLWVVQYLQYPFPAGLKIVKYDRYLRAVFDKVHRRITTMEPTRSRFSRTRMATGGSNPTKISSRA